MATRTLGVSTQGSSLLIEAPGPYIEEMKELFPWL
jgi:hypothetical protein